MGSSPQPKTGNQERAELDSALVKRAQAGDLHAFEELMRTYETPLFSFLVRWVGNKSDAEDILQETTLKAFRKLESFDTDRVFKPWLFRIAVNEAKSRWRQRGRERDRHQVLAQIEPRQRRISAELNAASVLEAGLAAVSSTDRQLLILRFAEHMSFEEISESMGIGKLGLKMRLSRARKRFREAVANAEAEVA